jgi:hypothetical protein
MGILTSPKLILLFHMLRIGNEFSSYNLALAIIKAVEVELVTLAPDLLI